MLPENRCNFVVVPQRSGAHEGDGLQKSAADLVDHGQGSGGEGRINGLDSFRGRSVLTLAVEAVLYLRARHQGEPYCLSGKGMPYTPGRYQRDSILLPLSLRFFFWIFLRSL